MGTQVLAALQGDSKPNYVLSTVAAGSVVTADDNFYLFVGATAITQLNVKTGLTECANKLRELGWPNPVTTEAAWASYETVTDTIAFGEGLDPTLTENMVAILKASGFTPAGVSGSKHSIRMYEKVLEEILKVA